MRDAISLESAPTIYTTVSGISEQNGNERQSATSLSLKKQPRHNMSLMDLTSLLAPPFKCAITSYGYNMYGKTAGSYPPGTGAGDLRNIYSPAGQQYWFEAVGLPASDRSFTPTIMDVDSLITKSKDIRNIADITPVSGQPLMQSTGESKELQFQYMSGYQRHEFVNAGNTTVHAEFWELHPRHPMTGYASNGTYTGVGADVLADMATNQPLANTLRPVYTTTSYDAVTDLSVRINKYLDTVNAKYKVSKPVRVTIQPGGTFVYTMKFEPFKFTNTEWNALIGTGTADTSHANLMPGFTKLLCARFWGELSHNAGSESHLYSAVNCGPVNLMHIQKEYHHCRACPYQPTKNVIIDYRLDTSAAATEHMDELNQDNEAFDD